MSLAIAFYLVLGSLSRMAIVAISILYLGLHKDLIKSNFYLGGVFVIVVIFMGVSLFSIAYQEGIGVEKINQVINGLAAGDLDYVSSGRLTLYRVALEQIFNSPFSGVSFGGFGLHVQSISGYADLAGLSPHNQYITLFWKMGFPAAFFYIVFLVAVVYRAGANCGKVFRKWVFRLCLIVLIVFSSLWDALLIPNVAVFFFFLMGAFSSQGYKLDEK
nr:O-antigen ligase family protein [Pseudomonas sp. MMS21 TM103]